MKNKVLIIVFSIFLVFTTNVFAADYSIDSYKIDAKVIENGDLEITEYIKYDFDADMNGLYRDILYSYIFDSQEDSMDATSSRYQASGIEDLEVFISDSSFNNMKKATKRSESSLSNGMDGYYSAEFSYEEESRLLVKVYSPVDSGDYKYVKYKYTVKDAVVNYQDFSEIYWNFVGGDWECSLNNVEIILTLPQETVITTYGHSYGTVTSFENDSKTITYKLSHLGSNVAADIRAVFPNTIMRAETIKKQVDSLYDFDTLYKVEETIAENIEKQKKYYTNFGIIIAISVVVGIVVVSKSTKKKEGVVKNYKKAAIFTDALENHSLVEYNKMLGAYNSSVTGNVIIATIMDLSHKKVINMNARKKLSSKKDEYEYKLSLNKNADFEKLTDYEKVIINYIFFIDDSDVIDTSKITTEEIDLNDRFKTLSKKTNLASKIRTLITNIDENERKAKYDNAPFKSYKPALITVLMLFIVFVINMFAFSPSANFGPAFMGIGIYSLTYLVSLALMVYTKGVQIKDEFVTEHNNLLGLKKYLSEYSLLKERYPIEIALWDRYMVFACLFGIAEKVAKEFKEELLANGLSEEDINTNYSYMYMASHSSTFNSTISAATYAGSSGSSSSGGFSGGGGGGRRWWRRRRFLITKKYIKGSGINKIYHFFYIF